MLAKVLCAGRTDTGKKRDSNQDQFLIADLHKSMLVQATSLNLDAQSRLYGMSHGKLFMVADGMGGHQAGSRASVLAIDLLINQLLNSMHWFFAVEPNREQDFIGDLKKLFQKAHQAIERESTEQVAHRGMGTTLTLAYVIWPWMYVVHAGDSRCYLLRGDKLEQLTSDHTISNQLVQAGTITAAETANSPWSNVLTNVLGAGSHDVLAEVKKVPLEVGDTVVLCTDGLNRHVEDGELRDIVQRELEPTECCRALIELANFRGGFDNITAIVARLLTPDESSQPKTKVAAEITLERLLGDISGYNPPLTDTQELPPECVDTVDFV